MSAELPLQAARFLAAAHLPAQIPPPGPPEIAFAGRSNVGKSSLINCLLGRKALVKTSAKPGKTRSINFFALEDAARFVDLPGYGYARVSQEERRHWGGLIEHYVTTRATLVCVVLIVDLRHEPKRQDLELADWLRHIGRPFLPVYTKADKLGRGEQARHAALLDAGFKVGPGERLLFSSQTGQGRAELLARLAEMAFIPEPSVVPPAQATSS